MPELLAYRLVDSPRVMIRPARRRRSWMDATDTAFANRCLPLLLGNQYGWELYSTIDVTITYHGGVERTALEFNFYGAPQPYPVSSHFGHGIVTWTVPYLFRLPSGWNLQVRGPANEIRDGLAPLEGIVEADWAPSTFTMNWIFTRRGASTTFRAGEPFCMIVPQSRKALESFSPRTRPIEVNAEEEQQYLHWRDGRERFIHDLHVPGTGAYKEKWQKDYFRGRTCDGQAFADHQTKLKLQEFVDETGTSGASQAVDKPETRGN